MWILPNHIGFWRGTIRPQNFEILHVLCPNFSLRSPRSLQLSPRCTRCQPARDKCPRATLCSKILMHVRALLLVPASLAHHRAPHGELAHLPILPRKSALFLRSPWLPILRVRSPLCTVLPGWPPLSKNSQPSCITNYANLLALGQYRQNFAHLRECSTMSAHLRAPYPIFAYFCANQTMFAHPRAHQNKHRTSQKVLAHHRMFPTSPANLSALLCDVI